MKQTLYLNNTVKKILQNTKTIANAEKSQVIESYHLFLSILYTQNNEARKILNKNGIFAPNKVINFNTDDENLNSKIDLKNLSPESVQILLNTEKLRKKIKKENINSILLLYSILTTKDTKAIKGLQKKNVNVSDLLDELNNYIFTNILSAPPTPTSKEIQNSPNNYMGSLIKKIEEIEKNEANAKKDTNQTPFLDHFTKDLTKEALDGKLTPIIGRDSEVERITHILNRKTKNNPILIGDAGVGKTAIVEGLAQLISQKKVPMKLQDKKILMLDITSVIAGTMYRGDFEKRILGIINEAKNKENNVILFIDEIHMLMGAGDINGSMDAANILKPALARNEIQIIGATTFDEYSKHIEKDPAFERRLQSIVVKEPNEQDTYLIIKGIKPSFENFHQINIDDEMIKYIVDLSKKYIPDKFFPDKAIDLLDESCAIKSTHHDYKNNYVNIKDIKQKIYNIRTEIDKNIAVYNYEEAAKLRKQELKLIEELNKIKSQQISENIEKSKVYSKNLEKKDILKVISQMTNIPLNELSEDEVSKFKNIESELSTEIKGQSNAIHKISTSIKRVASGLAKPNRPLSSFLLLGPSGVGKTLLVKKLAKHIFGSEDKMIRLDMSEYMDSISASKIIGAPAGYVGYEEGGWLINQVRKNPYSIILVDEIEKAHKDIFNIFLQILDEGHLTNNKGKKANFKNTIIIMTSNIGTDQLTAKAGPIGFTHDQNEEKQQEKEYQKTADSVLQQLKKRLPLEFLNRLDDIIIFDPLRFEDILGIAQIQINDLIQTLNQKGYKVSIDNKIYKYIAEKGYSIEYGARNIARTIQTELETKIADMILENKQNKNIKIDISKDGIIKILNK